jgi:hypothetical protein
MPAKKDLGQATAYRTRADSGDCTRPARCSQRHTGSAAERTAALMPVWERLAGDISATDPDAFGEEFRQAQAKRPRTIEAALVAVMASVSTAISRIQ